jgi:hypothetical protein
LSQPSNLKYPGCSFSSWAAIAESNLIYFYGIILVLSSFEVFSSFWGINLDLDGCLLIIFA